MGAQPGLITEDETREVELNKIQQQQETIKIRQEIANTENKTKTCEPDTDTET